MAARRTERGEGIHVFGIRHHGPGSARSLVTALEALHPDALLVEGPPDADALIPWAGDPELQPPAALLVYNPAELRQASYYPFAVFSPEWQALQYGLRAGIPVRFIDLPMACQFPLMERLQAELEAEQAAKAADGLGEGSSPAAVCALLRPEQKSGQASAAPANPAVEDAGPALTADPLAWIARSAGYSDGEVWWEHQVEQRRDGRNLFAAILTLMDALRAELESGQEAETSEMAGEAHQRSGLAPFEPEREAWMRRSIRLACKQGFERIAVVCGAWHAPALAHLERYSAAQDEHRLKVLPSVKAAAAWTPWSYGQLTWRSGYGAGIASPGWYHHLWNSGQAGLSSEETGVRWLASVAGLLRAADLEASSAQVIEATRLAETLAALRERPLPGLAELTEAAQSVFCQGEALPLRLIEDKLVVSERLGSIPAGAPALPLQTDLRAWQKRLRLPVEPGARDLDLDLRKPTDLQRSRLLHRLLLLRIPWGAEMEKGGALGTFHELWRIDWQPELALAVIDAARWGHTVADAAAGRAIWLGEQAEALADLTALLRRTLLAELPEAAERLMLRLENAAALSSDVDGMMAALPPLAETLRYGDVRRTAGELIERVTGGLVQRICIGLPPACTGVDDAAASLLFERLLEVHTAINVMQVAAFSQAWQAALRELAHQDGVHGLLAGRAGRLLLDSGEMDGVEAARRMGLALSHAAPAAESAAWLDGFLRGPGLLLLHDPRLWQVLDEWVRGLPEAAFIETLPLMRRAFAGFSRAERRQLNTRVREPSGAGLPEGPSGFDGERAQRVLPVLEEIFGISG